MLGIYQVPAQLVAARVVLSSTESVSQSVSQSVIGEWTLKQNKMSSEDFLHTILSVLHIFLVLSIYWLQFYLINLWHAECVVTFSCQRTYSPTSGACVGIHSNSLQLVPFGSSFFVATPSPSPDDGKISNFWNASFSTYLEFRTMGKVQKPSDSGCYSPPSEPFTFYLYIRLLHGVLDRRTPVRRTYFCKGHSED
jgi:hypothetical protein